MVNNGEVLGLESISQDNLNHFYFVGICVTINTDILDTLGSPGKSINSEVLGVTTKTKMYEHYPG